MQARIEEAGQSLLRNAHDRDSGAFSQLSRKKFDSGRTRDAYEEHLLILEERVVVLTDRAIVCIHAPGFATIHAAAEQGTQQNAPDIKNAEIRWSVLWEVGLLTCIAESGLPNNAVAIKMSEANLCTMLLLQLFHPLNDP